MTEQQTEVVSPIPPMHVDTVENIDDMKVYRRIVLNSYNRLLGKSKAAEVMVVGRRIPDSLDNQYVVRSTYWVGLEDDGISHDYECDSFRHALAVFDQQLQFVALIVR